MIVTTHQPIFLPWPGFFAKALCADVLVLLDMVQFPLGRSWLTRNRLKSDQGEVWLRVPVWKTGKGIQRICDVEICDDSNWRKKHRLSIHEQYAHAPYVDDYLPLIETIYAQPHRRLVEFNQALIRMLWDALGLQSRLLLQSELGVVGTGTALLVAICNALHADTYATMPFVEKYLDLTQCRTDGVSIRFVHFRPPIYPQLWGEFRFNLSALDLLCNCGPKSRDILVQASHR